MAKKQSSFEVEPEEMVKVIRPLREDGWFCYEEYEIPLSVLVQKGERKSKSLPELFYVFQDQVNQKIRSFFDL